MLIQHVYAEARRQDCSRVYWLTHETNTAAMQLYDRIAERSGFIQYRHALSANAGGEHERAGGDRELKS
jgi:hypothetical protein